MSVGSPVWPGHVVIVPLRRAAVVGSVLVWLGAVAVVPFVAGMVIVVMTAPATPDRLVMVLVLASLIAVPVTWLAAAIGAAVWAWRARSDAAFVSADRHRFDESWAATGWFIPVAGLAIPLIVVTDLVRAARPAGVGTAMVRRWWTAWIVGSVVLPVCAFASPATPCPDAVLIPAIVLAAVALAVAAALFTRITLAVASVHDAALRRAAAQWSAFP
jgi:uncharacterized protein DUF4328